MDDDDMTAFDDVIRARLDDDLVLYPKEVLAAHLPRTKYRVVEDEAGWQVFILNYDPSFT